MAEINFEVVLGALESTRGNAVAPPTHVMNMEGSLVPNKTLHRPNEFRGTLAANYRSVITRRGSTFEAKQSADGFLLPFWLNMGVKGGITSPTTPGGGTLSRDWTFIRNITGDDIRSATMYFGDPNVQVWQADFCMLDEIVLENDASEDDGVLMLEIKGTGGRAIKVAAPTVPALSVGPLYPAQLMQLWIDTTGAIGTTPVTGRLISAKHTIQTGVVYKHLAAGPTSNLDYTKIGRKKVAGITTELMLELPDMAQYDQWDANTPVKCRVRHNGPLIEGALYNHIEVDTYGVFGEMEWDEFEDTNRAIKLVIEGEVDATLGSDLRVQVRNTRTTI